jgi:hypothetical protein
MDHQKVPGNQKELDNLKRQVLEFTSRNIKTPKKRLEMQERIEELFERIRLPGRQNAILVRVRRRAGELMSRLGCGGRRWAGRSGVGGTFAQRLQGASHHHTCYWTGCLLAGANGLPKKLAPASA